MRAHRPFVALLVALATTALTVTASAPARAAGGGDITGLVNGARAAAGCRPSRRTPSSRASRRHGPSGWRRTGR
ncbi:hypothetical protein NKG05_28495 [Oerskovia sp. M15]